MRWQRTLVVMCGVWIGLPSVSYASAVWITLAAGVPKDMEIKIAGESLFNDGVGVVVFLGLLEIATGSVEPAYYSSP